MRSLHYGSPRFFPRSSAANFLCFPSLHMSHMPSHSSVNGMHPKRMFRFTQSHQITIPPVLWEYRSISLDVLLPLGFISFRSGYHVHAFFIRSSCFLCILFIACLVLSSTRYPAPIFLLTHLEDTKVWVQFCMGEPRARGQC